VNALVQAGRALALLLLSLHAVACARLAWASGRDLLVSALLLVLATLAGELLPLLGAVLGSAATRLRFRVLVYIGYAGLSSMLTLIAVGEGDPGLLARQALAFAALQPVLLVLQELLGGARLPIANALLLVVLASLRGGNTASLAVVGHLLLLGPLLALERLARLSASVRLPGAVVLATLRQAVLAVAPLGIALFLLFGALPPRPYARLGSAGLSGASQEEADAALRRLTLVALFGGGLVFFIARLLRRGSADAPPLDDATDAEWLVDEPLPEPALGDAAYEGPRGRIVRAYLRVLARAREAGFRLRPHHTAREIESALREPAGPLRELTRHFSDARYGPDEPGPEAVAEAETAASELLAVLRPRRRLSARFDAER
jgi:hypothetical protein